MSRQPRSAKKDTTLSTGKNDPLRVLLVDHDSRVGRQVARYLASMRIELVHVDTLAQARQHTKQNPFDLALIAVELPDGPGLSLAKQLRDERSCITQTILLTDRPSLEQTVQALRSGVGDLLVKPLKRDEVYDRILHAAARWKDDHQSQRRLQRLRRTCKKLKNARDEVSRQVDVLCNDLVTAYQELAQQLHVAVETSEYCGIIREELDLEALLHRTLEYILEKAGPTNAAIYLPATCDEYTLSGYVNFDCTDEAAEILWQYLADEVTHKIADRTDPILITGNEMIAQWLGTDNTYLTERQVLAYPCLHEDEVLAIIILFRDECDPYENNLVDTCRAVAPVIGRHLAKVVRIHHRHLPAIDDASDKYI